MTGKVAECPTLLPKLFPASRVGQDYLEELVGEQRTASLCGFLKPLGLCSEFVGAAQDAHCRSCHTATQGPQRQNLRAERINMKTECLQASPFTKVDFNE